MISEKVS